VGALFRARQLEDDMAAEMRHHLDLLAEELVAQGLSPAEAAARARREFGPVDRIREDCREERGFLWLSQLGQDLAYAGRTMARAPGFTIAAVLTLAFGIGVNTGIVSLADQILLRQLPVRDPGGLILLHWGAKADFPVPVGGSWENDPVLRQWTCTSFSRSAFAKFRARDGVLDGLLAFSPVPGLTLVSGGHAETIPLGQLISGDGFSVLGIRPAAGRAIEASDDRPEAAPVAMISYAYWMRRFAGDPAVVGQTILVNRLPLTVIGVAPRNFAGTLQVGDNPDLYFPLALAATLSPRGSDEKENPDKVWWLQIMARLKPGATGRQAEASLEPILEQCARDSLAAVGAASPPGGAGLPRLIVGPGGQGLSEIRHQYAREWEILVGLGGTVLAIACANLANLLLARGVARRREIGVRLAMGAGRGRIARQLFTESSLLAALGGALAIPFALWIEVTLVAMQPKLEGHALALDPHLDGRILLVAMLLSMVTGLVFGSVPALRASRVNINAEFQGGTGARGGVSHSALVRTILVGQVALSLVLLVGAGLFARTLRNLHGVDVGFDRGNLLLFELDPNPAGSDFELAAATNRRMAERLRSLPGVESVTFSKIPLLANQGWNTRLRAVGGSRGAQGKSAAMLNAVGADFFGTYRIPIIRGRGLEERDEGRPSPVAVINQAMAAAYFGEDDPVGRTFEVEDLNDHPTLVEVVGVARDARYSAVRSVSPATIYLPFSASRSMRTAAATFAVRSAGNPTLMSSVVVGAGREVDPLIPMSNLRTEETQIDDLSANERIFAWLSGLFGVLALGLVGIGLYGLLAYSVQRRTGEIGLRMALGACPEAVVAMILRESLLLVAIGLGFGLMGAWVSARAVASLLYGLSATDPAVFLGGAGLLLFIALLAAWLPARRAARIDPIAALRTE